MAVSVPARYYLRSALFTGEVRLGADILAAQALTCLRNATRQYAAGCLRALYERAWTDGLKTTAAGGGSREVMAIDTALFGAGRKSLTVTIDGQDIDWEVHVRDSARSASLGSATGAIGGTRTLSSTTINLSSTAQDVTVEVLGKLNGAASSGYLYGVRALEVAVVAADLPA